ncbi:MAG: PHP domain-containing protein [Clostridia bacterium]|nr:PHP domain-containing protein [Clostridia bacterium]
MIKKILAVMMSAVMILSFSQLTFAADETTATDIDYAIKNPYANVDWDTYGQYKTDLHTHTTFSDGGNPLPDMVERHYEYGFDAMAVTDHGTVNTGFTNQEFNAPMTLFSLIKNKGLYDDVLSESGTAANGNNYTVTFRDNDEYYAQEGEREMLRVPFGNEQNPTSFNNAHVNSFFVNYGDGVVGGTSNYVSPIKNVHARGGLSVINHPGEYTNARDEVYTEDAYNRDEFIYNYKIQRFINLLKDYDSCIGIDINSKGDSRTRFDRKLWDILLQEVVPAGRNVHAIATTDAHNLNIVDSGYTVMVLPELTSKNVRTAMEEGSFFAASSYVGNYDELLGYYNTLNASEDSEAKEFAAVIKTYVDQIALELAEGDQGTKFHVEDMSIPAPKVTNIVVDDDEDTISVDTENALLVHWIADGEVIATGNTIDLDDYSDKIGSYVRAEFFGKGGIMYSQAFMLDYEGAPEETDGGVFVDVGLVASAICDTIVKALVAALEVPLTLLRKVLTK